MCLLTSLLQLAYIILRLCLDVPSSLWCSSGLVHLIPDAWQLSKEDNSNNAKRNADLQHLWHPIYLKHLLRLVNCPTKRPAVEEWVGVWHSGEFERLTLTSGPPTAQQVQASCPNTSGFSPKNTSSICWISLHIRLPEALLVTDACRVTLIPATTPIHI